MGFVRVDVHICIYKKALISVYPSECIYMHCIYNIYIYIHTHICTQYLYIIYIYMVPPKTNTFEQFTAICGILFFFYV